MAFSELKGLTVEVGTPLLGAAAPLARHARSLNPAAGNVPADMGGLQTTHCHEAMGGLQAAPSVRSLRDRESSNEKVRSTPETP